VSAALIGVSSGFTDYGDYLGIAFARPLEVFGAAVVSLPYTSRPHALLDHLDGLVLAGGRDIEPPRFGGRAHPSATAHSPLRDEFELALMPAAIAAGVPLIAFCRGMQIMNVAFGGTLYPDHSVLAPPADTHPGGDWDRWAEVVRARLRGLPPPTHPSHEIMTEPGSTVAEVLGPRAVVNSYHHQSIAKLGEGLVVTARSPDGVIEAIELPSAVALCVGVQWEEHEQPGTPLFELLVRAASARAASGRRGPGLMAAIDARAARVRPASG
jgi:putative glutamine amidotransferase